MEEKKRIHKIKTKLLRKEKGNRDGWFYQKRNESKSSKNKKRHIKDA